MVKTKIKQIISSVLALAMVFSMGTSSVAFAAEDEGGEDMYSVTLSDAENGRIEFNEENEDGKFAAGDEVELKLIADDGYIPARFTITETDSGNEVITKDATDNLYSFSMPSIDLTVQAEFAVDENADPDDTITVDEIENDLLLEEYIRENANPKYVDSVDSMTWVNIMDIQNTFFDGTAMDKDDTIASIMYSSKVWSAFITSVPTSVAVYNVNNDSDYFVALVDTMLDVDKAVAFDYEVAENNDEGNAIDGCIFESKTGLLYIPKTLYTDGDTYEINTIQAQIGQKIKNGDYAIEADTECAVIDDGTADIYKTLDEIFSMETKTKVQAGLDEDTMAVYVNGVQIDEDCYDYNAATGELTIPTSSAAIATLSVMADPDQFEDAEDKSSAIDNALTVYAGEDHPSTFSEMYVLNEDEPIEMPGWTTVGTAFVTDGDDGGIDVQHWTSYAIDGHSNEWYGGATKGYIWDYGNGVNGGWNDKYNSQAMSDLRRQVTAVWTWDESDEIISDFAARHLYTAESGLYFKFRFDKKKNKNFTYQSTFQGEKLNNVRAYTPDDDDADDEVDFTGLGDVLGQCVHIYGDAGQAKVDVSHCPVMARVLYIKHDKSEDKDFACMAFLSAAINYTGYIDHDDGNGYVGSDQGQNGWCIGYVEIDTNGYAKLHKDSGNTIVTDGNDNYDLAGAEYSVYKDEACTTAAKNSNGKAAVFKTKSNGDSQVIEMPCGEYWTKETKAATNYKLDENVYHFEVTGDETSDTPVVINSVDQPVTAWVTLTKESENSSITDDNSCYNLKGTEYTIYTDKSCDDSSIAKTADGSKAVLTTDEDGKTEKLEMALGTYYVKETKRPGGYQLVDTVYTVVLTASNTEDNPYVIEAVDPPITDPLGFEIRKIDLESGRDQAQGSASLEGAEFTVKFYAGYFDEGSLPSEPTRTWKFKTVEKDGQYIARHDVDGSFISSESDALYTYNGSTVFPLGTYTVEESGAPEGYLIKGTFTDGNGDAVDADSVYYTQLKDDGSGTGDGIWLSGGNEYTEADQVKRGDIALRKHEAETQEAMSVPFQITSQTTGESHVFWTDSNGDYSSDSTWAKHTYKTDLGEDYTDGLYFYGYSDWETCGVEVDDSLGALPYDTYTLDELECEANEGKELVHTTFTVYQDERVIDLGQYLNADKDIEISTTLTNDWEGEHGEHEATVFENANISLTDTVHYSGLTVGKTYTMKGVLMNKATGEVILDDNGEEVRAEKTFTPEEEEGDVEITFSFPASTLSYTDVVAYEYLYKEGGDEPISFHEDINDTDQTVHLRRPTVWTEATEVGTGNKYVEATDDVNIVDMLDITDLLVGHTYYLYGKAVDKETGEIIIDENGDPIELTVEFVAESEEVLLDVMNFHIDALGMEGKSIVFEEYVFADADRTILICEEEDLGSAEQTITFLSPIDLETTLIDAETESHSSVQDDHVVLIDTVEYEGAIVGETYTMTGTLMDKATGEAVHNLDGSDVTATTEFVAEEESGEVKMTFEFDATGLEEGDATVAYEQMFNSEGTLVGSHEDIDDEGQTVHFPEIHTNATDSETGTNVTEADDEAIIVDTVTYEGLTPGQEYTVEGTLMNKANGEAVVNADGEPVTGSTTFTPEEADGTVEVTFTLDASDLGGSTLVVFEDLLVNEVVVASHADLSDEDQTIYVPDIQTTATDAYDGDHEVEADGTVTIIDTVDYENLIPGQEYTMHGELMDENTGDSLGISNEVTFTPEEANGSVEIEFTFDASDMAGYTTVVFEKLYMTTEDGDQVEVAKHEDLTDEGQTVYLAAPPTTGTPSNGGTPTETYSSPSETPEKVQTGDNDMMCLLALMAAVCMACGFGLCYRRREDN